MAQLQLIQVICKQKLLQNDNSCNLHVYITPYNNSHVTILISIVAIFFDLELCKDVVVSPTLLHPSY